MEPDPPPSPEIVRLARSDALPILVLLIGCVAPGIWIAGYLPRFRDLFKNLFGSTDKLPGLTTVVINNPALVAWIGMAIPLIGAFALFRLSRRKLVGTLILVFAMAILYSLLLAVSITTPYVRVTFRMSSS